MTKVAAAGVISSVTSVMEYGGILVLLFSKFTLGDTGELISHGTC